MKYLLDTHAMLWVVGENQFLTQKARKIYLDDRNEIYLSAASLWEMAIKISLKKLRLSQKLSLFVEKHVIGNNIQVLDVTTEHLYPLATLPFHHRDPFDRLLVSQCQKEKMVLISKDDSFDKYSIKRVW